MMKYTTLQFCDSDREMIDERNLTSILEQFCVGTPDDYDLSMTPSLIIKRGTASKTFIKSEIDFLKDYYGRVEYDDVPDDELFKWNRYIGKDLIKECKNDFMFALLVELNMKLGRFYVYERKEIPDDVCVLIHIF